MKPRGILTLKRIAILPGQTNTIKYVLEGDGFENLECLGGRYSKGRKDERTQNEYGSLNQNHFRHWCPILETSINFWTLGSDFGQECPV